MPALTSVKYSNKKVKKIVTVSVIAVVIVVAAVFGVKLLLDNGVFSKKGLDFGTMLDDEEMNSLLIFMIW